MPTWIEWLEAIKARKNAVPQGRWYWNGVKHHKTVSLLTTENGHESVMDFTRWGLQSAAPRFKQGWAMERIDDMVIPRQSHRPDGEFIGIDHPVAEFIAHSPEDIAKLIQAVESVGNVLVYARNQMDYIQHRSASFEEATFECERVEQRLAETLAQLQSGEFPVTSDE